MRTFILTVVIAIAAGMASAARFDACDGSGDRFAGAVRRARESIADIPRGAAFSVARAVLSRDEVEIATMDGTTVEPPFERFVFVFVDEVPGANWAHPCRYVIFNEDLSDFETVRRMLPPTLRSRAGGGRIALTGLGGGPRTVTLEKTVGQVRAYANALRAVAAKHEIDYAVGKPTNSYFLLVSGGVDQWNNEMRFWADTAMYYSTLTLKYKVPKENITLLVSDGREDESKKDAYVDVYDDDTETSYQRQPVSSPADLDGDGVADVTGPATSVAVSGALKSFKAKLTKDDQLTVFITSHGAQTGGKECDPDDYSCVAWLYNWDKITDAQLANLTKGIACPVAFAIETCFAGGFIDDLCAVPNRVVATACRHDQYSFGNEDQLTQERYAAFDVQISSFNTWALPFTCAMRGFIPRSIIESETDRYPWNDYIADDWDLVKDADANGDRLVSFREAYEFAVANDDCARPGSKPHEDPQFAESTPGLGDRFFTLKQTPVETMTFASAAFGTVTLPKEYVEAVTGDHGTYDPDADWDGDGAVNYAEYVAGTDPNKADDRFAIGGFELGTNGWLSLTFPRHAGRRYTLKAAESPVGPWAGVWFGTAQDEDDFVPSLTCSPEDGVGPVETTIYARPGDGRFFKMGVERGSAL